MDCSPAPAVSDELLLLDTQIHFRQIHTNCNLFKYVLLHYFYNDIWNYIMCTLLPFFRSLKGASRSLFHLLINMYHMTTSESVNDWLHIITGESEWWLMVPASYSLTQCHCIIRLVEDWCLKRDLEHFLLCVHFHSSHWFHFVYRFFRASPQRPSGSSADTLALAKALLGPASSVAVTVGTIGALGASSMHVSIRSATTGTLETIQGRMEQYKTSGL